ncbi:hypothetical protein FQN60_007108 [Etheostoma spectabile]|uniref:DUF659 domain-containing protein n=1 Tax=Etheostoma spectabile TaxID=54343 RepID=A0A5J5CA05_9PERO|nr:hypothetical protein FQN60_007108 [Etheostoma spectabile]
MATADMRVLGRRVQTTLNVPRPSTKSTSDHLTNTKAKWIAKDCRPISIVEDSGFLDVLRVASQDSSSKPPSRDTVMTKIHELYENEEEQRKEVLAQVNHIALTGDHWTSESNNSYLGVTAHFIRDTWELKSFALTILKTEECDLAEACEDQFLPVAREWDIEGKTTSRARRHRGQDDIEDKTTSRARRHRGQDDIEGKTTTIGTDSARNMVAAIRLTRYEHMTRVAHTVQRSVTVSLADSGFVNASAEARKVPSKCCGASSTTSHLEQKNEPWIQNVPTRWNSTLEMVKRVSRKKEAVIAALDHQEHKLVQPTEAGDPSRAMQCETLCPDVGLTSWSRRSRVQVVSAARWSGVSRV